MYRRLFHPLLTTSLSIRSMVSSLVRPTTQAYVSRFSRAPATPPTVLLPRLARNMVTTTMTKAKQFDELDLSPEVLESVQSLGFQEATEIQSMVIPTLIHDRHSDFAVASHTGSGKTLAYMLPILHALKEAEAVDGMPVKPKRPRALVLGPTRELVEQIYGVTRQLTKVAKCRSVLLTGGADMTMGVQKAALGKGVDVAIGTPARVVQHARAGNLYYGDVDFIVLGQLRLRQPFDTPRGQLRQRLDLHLRVGVPLHPVGIHPHVRLLRLLARQHLHSVIQTLHVILLQLRQRHHHAIGTIRRVREKVVGLSEPLPNDVPQRLRHPGVCKRLLDRNACRANGRTNGGWVGVSAGGCTKARAGRLAKEFGRRKFELPPSSSLPNVPLSPVAAIRFTMA